MSQRKGAKEKEYVCSSYIKIEICEEVYHFSSLQPAETYSKERRDKNKDRVKCEEILADLSNLKFYFTSNFCETFKNNFSCNVFYVF